MELREYTICPLVSKGFGAWETAVCNDACAWYEVSTQGCIMQGIARSLEDRSSNMDLLERKMGK